MLFALALTLLLPITPARAQRGAPFPHERHQRLFPLCESCHAGIVTGDARQSMRSPAFGKMSSRKYATTPHMPLAA